VDTGEAEAEVEAVSGEAGGGYFYPDSEDEAAEAGRLMADAHAADTAYRLAAVKVTVYEFLHQYGHSELPAFKVALDLAVSLRKIVDGTGEGA